MIDRETNNRKRTLKWILLVMSIMYRIIRENDEETKSCISGIMNLKQDGYEIQRQD